MYRNYLLVALRQLRKQKMYTAIKIGGFALSIAACILITLYILDELSVDKNVPRQERIFRIVNRWTGADKETYVSDPAPLGPTLMSDYPQVQEAGRIMANPLFTGAGANQIRKAGQDQNTYEEGFAFADQSLLDVLGVHMIYGTPGHALDKPNTMVLTRRMSEKYFPHQNPVGQVFYLNNDKTKPYTVGGVIPDFASRSSLPYDFFLTMKGVELWPDEQTNWSANNYEDYVLLKPGVDVHAFEKELTASEVTRHIIPTMKSFGTKDADERTKHFSYYLQPVRDVYLKSYDIGDGLTHGDIRLVWMFGGIACFILLIACINFINLATAKSANRAKEVGLRKVVGSYKGGLIRQFLTESMVYSVLSFMVALVLATALLPFFNQLTNKSLSIPWGMPWFVPILLASIFVVGIVAGLYPAFYLSAFKPAKVLKGEVARGSRNARLRSVLVVFQFTTSIILIIGTFFIYRQMQYILHAKLGFDKDQVLAIQGTNTITDIQAFKNDLLKLPQSQSVSISDYLPVRMNGTKTNGNSFYIYSKRTETTPIFGQFWIVDYDYITTMGMHLREGRDFSRAMASDTAAVVINRTMVNKLGLGKHPVGTVITNYGTPFLVIGVIDDFTPYFKYDNPPVCLSLGISPSIVSIKLKSADAGRIIPEVTAVWKRYVPNQALRYTFMDEGFRHMYADVQRTGAILTYFTILAIIVACLGLFALSSFLAEQRTKEIGIRKVLGASVSQLLVLMSRDFVVLIVISVLIATPIAWWAVHAWLQDFKSKTDVNIWIFLGVGVVALVIALLTTAYQSIRAALDNPIKSLKSE